jgi:hypothetical protein
MNKTALATFRVDEGKWERFKELARESGHSASALLVAAIDRCIDDGVEPPISRSGSIDINIDRTIESYLDKNLDKYLQTSLDKVIDKSIEDISQRVRDLEASTTSQLEALREETAEVSEFARNLQGEIVKVKKPLALV